ncbi:hypothetical protein HIM_10247 [Hirsutella minnesotensis 3608]|uniref:HTH CENPB-type domain-containing protein n=1 Tax=Hirsutella minnesotensis 3608 TaxID=1043627 RepID=A0A0F7ZG66_9HYPO|nr:hypothetical protein HIM_10247 [Hirsutella minnesotensis 3608]
MSTIYRWGWTPNNQDTTIARFFTLPTRTRRISAIVSRSRSRDTESRIEEALQYLNDVPGARVASVARAFGVPRSRLRYRLEGRQPKAGRPAANLKLSRPEEAALCRYIDRLDNMNLAVRPEFITDAANNILRERSGQADFVIGSKWTSRFLKRHGYFKKLQKKLHAERQAAEDLVRVTQYFQSLEKVVQEQGIPPEDIWNMDETGFRIGVGKDQ